jgi:hypothetical protein
MSHSVPQLDAHGEYQHRMNAQAQDDMMWRPSHAANEWQNGERTFPISILTVYLRRTT